MNYALRKDLPELPDRIKALPVGPNGYPVPFFVASRHGKPDFRLADPLKLIRCVRENLCWVCGQKLGKFKSFVVGPMCTMNSISAEPPSHLECAEFSCKACPYLAKPNMERRREKDGSYPGENTIGQVLHKPGAMAVWTVDRAYKPQGQVDGSVLFHVPEPVSLTWWTEGRLATRAEVLDAFEVSYQRLMADGDTHGIEEVIRLREKGILMLPAA